MAYVYKHTRLDTNAIFYIGIGSDKTFKRAYQMVSRNRYWVHVYKKTKIKITVLHSNIDWRQACELEKYYIHKYGRSNLGLGTLVNLTDGGDGTAHAICSQVSREMRSRRMRGNQYSKGNVISEHQKNAVRKANIGNQHWRKRKEHGKHVPFTKKVIDTLTGVVYNSVKEAAVAFHCWPNYLTRKLKGKQSNNTTLLYYEQSHVFPINKINTAIKTHTT